MTRPVNVDAMPGEGDAQPWTMAGMLREQAALRGAAPALVFEDKVTSYTELDDHASRVANGLIAAGLTRQQRVAILDFNSSRYFEVFFGSVKAACTQVGINARLAPPEVEWIVNDAAARVLFVGREHYALIEAIRPQLRTVHTIIDLDGEHGHWPAFDQWRDAQSAVDPAPALHADDDIIQLYTSGTTGHPKGVCHTNRTAAAFARASREAGWGRAGHDSVWLVCMPAFHVAGLNQTWIALMGGGRVVHTRKVDPAEIVEVLERHGITDTLFVPAIILALVNQPGIRGRSFGRLQRISYGAAPIAQDLLAQAREVFDCEFVHLYGQTENLGGSTYLPAEMHALEAGKLRSCGRAYSGSEVRIVDEAGNDVATGTVGEILVRSAWLMRCYWNGAEATADTLRDGWLHSGDTGYLDDDGYLYIHDRVKDMIKTGGENVYPAEVENALFGHPAIADVAVIGVPDDRWGEVVKAIVVLKPGAALDQADILRHARARIGGYKVPRSIDVVAELPRNASGKVLRRELRERYWAGHGRRVN